MTLINDDLPEMKRTSALIKMKASPNHVDVDDLGRSFLSDHACADSREVAAEPYALGGLAHLQVVC